MQDHLMSLVELFCGFVLLAYVVILLFGSRLQWLREMLILKTFSTPSNATSGRPAYSTSFKACMYVYVCTYMSQGHLTYQSERSKEIR